MFTTRQVDTWKDVLDQGALWETLHHQLAPENLFVSMLWSEIWFNTHLENSRQKVFLLSAAKEAERGIMLLSKGRTKRFKLPVKSIESVGAGVSASDLHFVVRQEPLLTREAIDPLLQRIATFENWAFFRLAPLPATYPFYDAFNIAAKRYGLFVFRRPYSTGYKIRTSGGWEAYVKSRSKNFRKAMRSSYKKMQENDLFSIETWTEPGDVEHLLDILNSISMKSWKLEARTDLFNSRWQGFWKQAIRDTLAAQKATIWVLYYQGQPIAYEWVLRQGDCIIDLKGDFDREFAGFSPGNLLLWHAIQHGFKTGASEIDLLMGGGEYKNRWATERYRLDELLIFNKSLYSRVWYKILSRQDEIRALYQSLNQIMVYFK